MKPERDRVKALLTEAVTLLCKNSVTYQAEVEVEGLLGITVDRNEVFLVSLHELISKRPDTQQVLQHQSFTQQFTSTPSYSPTPSKRKRRRKSGEGTPHQVPKKMTPVTSSDASEAIVLEDDDEGSNGTIDYQEGAQSAQNTGDTNLDSSQGQGDPTSDTTFDDFQDTSNPAAFSDQSALGSTNTGGDNSQANLEAGDTDQLSQEHYGGDDSTPGASDSITSVKREKFDTFSPQQDDSLGGGFDSFEPEQKWSATMGMMQQGDGPPSMVGGTGFAMAQGASAQQSPNTQIAERNFGHTSTPVLMVKVGNPPLLAGVVDALYICPKDQCQESFSKGIDLLRHQMSRSHFQNSRCEVCMKNFASDFVVKRHIKSVHENIKFQCLECGNMYGRLYIYKEHRRKEHGIIE